MLVQQIYPQNPKLQSEIPLWLKFRCFEYISFVGRYANAGGEAPGTMPSPPRLLGSIYVPAPNSLASGVVHAYNENSAQIIADSASVAAATAAATTGIGTLLGVAGFDVYKKTREFTTRTFDTIKAFYNLATYFGGIVPPDFNDNLYAGTGKRNFAFEIVLPCLTPEDNLAAYRVGRSFETLSMPSTSGNVLAFRHPPLWGFGVGAGTGPFIDNTWLTNPQLAVLEKVVVNRSAPDKGSFAVLIDAGFKPTVYTVNLSFQEIEPVYRQGGTLNVLSRSQAFAAASGSIQNIFNSVTGQEQG